MAKYEVQIESRTVYATTVEAEDAGAAEKAALAADYGDMEEVITEAQVVFIRRVVTGDREKDEA
jgi:hypothetical protein